MDERSHPGSIRVYWQFVLRLRTVQAFLYQASCHLSGFFQTGADSFIFWQAVDDAEYQQATSRTLRQGDIDTCQPTVRFPRSTAVAATCR